MKCNRCGGPMTALFYTSVCDPCESGRVVYYAVRGPLMVGAYYWSLIYSQHEHAALFASKGGRVEPVFIEGPLRSGVDYWVCPAGDPTHRPPANCPVARYEAAR